MKNKNHLQSAENLRTISIDRHHHLFEVPEIKSNYISIEVEFKKPASVDVSNTFFGKRLFSSNFCKVVADFDTLNSTFSGSKVHKLLDFGSPREETNASLSSSLSQKFGQFLNQETSGNSFKKLTCERTSFRDVEWRII